ncbi:MAG TPA: DNA polymerase III subunit alpha, partial [Kribbella sp.]|nr:DNA polymerase III subunit alpha [Kribbella sp.]
MGIKVLPPDVNESLANFGAYGDDVVLFGLSAVRNVGDGVVDAIVRSRAGGRYASFPDFLAKVEAVACSKRATESLIQAGAFDTLGHTRKGLLSRHEELVENALAVKRKEAEGQFDLFGTAESPVFALDESFPDDEWDKPVLLAREREMLGLYVSDHPLFGLESVLASRADVGIAQLSDQPDGAVVTIGGIISN